MIDVDVNRCMYFCTRKVALIERVMRSASRGIKQM